MIVTTKFDHTPQRWAFRIRDRENDLIEYDSDAVYLRDADAREAGQDAIDFSAHRMDMEGSL
jgi:hypothetical protein